MLWEVRGDGWEQVKAGAESDLAPHKGLADSSRDETLHFIIAETKETDKHRVRY